MAVEAAQVVAGRVPRLRRARSLVIFFEDERAIAWNFLTKQAFAIDPIAVELLASMDKWCEPRKLFDQLGEFAPAAVGRELGALVERGALVAEGTDQAFDDLRYEEHWEWGWVAGAYHFTVKNEPFADEDETRRILSERVAHRRPPPLVSRNAPPAVSLPAVDLEAPLERVLWARRSERWFAADPMPTAALATCLFDGFGVTGYVEDSVLGRMPLTMTPSGGARNPYDGYVYLRNVEGLDAGVYRYSGLDHTLALVAATPLPPASRLLADQEWADDAAAIVFLVANFGRTSYKYVHPSAYRVVLCEAGHIGQNLQLAATQQGVASVPTCALSEASLETLLQLDPIRQSVVYAVGLGCRAGGPVGPVA